MNLLSHEIAHSAGYKSETSAIKISSISTFALKIIKSYYKEKAE